MNIRKGLSRATLIVSLLLTISTTPISWMFSEELVKNFTAVGIINNNVKQRIDLTREEFEQVAESLRSLEASGMIELIEYPPNISQKLLGMIVISLSIFAISFVILKSLSFAGIYIYRGFRSNE